jgi:hypothetical protein
LAVRHVPTRRLKTPNERVSEAFSALEKGDNPQSQTIAQPRRTPEHQAVVDAVAPFIGGCAPYLLLGVLCSVPVVAQGK